MIRYIKNTIRYLEMNEKIDRKTGKIIQAEDCRKNIDKLYPLLHG